MSRDYSYEIYSLRQQISTMSGERADILNKISILKQNKSKNTEQEKSNFRTIVSIH